MEHIAFTRHQKPIAVGYSAYSNHHCRCAGCVAAAKEYRNQREARRLLCVEMHCAGRAVEHEYGSPECDWILTAQNEALPK